MNKLLRCAALCAILGAPAGALAQSADAQSAGSPAPADTRPATSSFLGDTGLWFVPTGEVLPQKKASGGFYYINQDFQEAFADVADFAGVAAYGIGNRAELFGTVQFYRRIDADRRPVLSGGVPVGYPNFASGWQTGVGDVYVGGKVNVSSQADRRPVAFGIRGVVKLPTASYDNGLGSGKVGFLADAIVSKEVNERVEVSGYAGVGARQSPGALDLPAGFRYGFGVAVPTRQSLRFTAEAFGEKYFDNTIATRGPSAASGTDPTRGDLPPSFEVKSPFDVFVGLDWTTKSGFFVGAGFRANLNFDSRSSLVSGVGNRSGDNMGGQVRFGFHPGVRVFAPPPLPPPPPPPPPANRPPTVKARCEPCVVQVGKSSTVTGDALDPDGDTLAYKWSAPTGALANSADRQTLWTAPEQEGSVPVTVTVDDGKGGTATDTVTIQVVKPPVKEYTFEDVHFDFDRYSLRPEATRVLDEAVRAMADNPELKIEIEGHTCSIGTAEYNLALGERRAQAVRDYLLSRGVGTDRLKTVSYGEERPKYDNSREETRRLNRRAALVVRLTQ
jgi:outer membrane protein OmpA-like peptidoglycan-associated protein